VPSRSSALLSFVCQLLAIVCDLLPLSSDPISSANQPFASSDLSLTPHQSLLALIKREGPAFELVSHIGMAFSDHD
jgi:hypothetical protein